MKRKPKTAKHATKRIGYVRRGEHSLVPVASFKHTKLGFQYRLTDGTEGIVLRPEYWQVREEKR